MKKGGRTESKKKSVQVYKENKIMTGRRRRKKTTTKNQKTKKSKKGERTELAIRIRSRSEEKGDGNLINWFPDPSQTNFTGSGGR